MWASLLFSACNQGKFSAVASLNLSRAFVTVNHHLLESKLKSIGLNDRVCAWLASYLNDKKQCVRNAGATSDSLPIVSGMSQGSILGPLLFLIYIDDSLTSIPAENIMPYTDDVTLLAFNTSEFAAISDLQNLINTIGNIIKDKWPLT